MTQINIHQAKTHLSKLVEDAAKGEEIVIAKGGKPVAKLGPLVKKTKVRKPGALKYRLKIPADFDAPMAENELALWYDGALFPGGSRSK